MKIRVGIATVIMGFSGLAAEILLLRELLIVFSGNELSIGLILANWLILEAFGCYCLGRTVERCRNKPAMFALLGILFALSLILTVFPLRNLKQIIGVSIGETVGLLPIFYSSFLILLPVSVLHGALFTYGCRIYALFSGKERTSAGSVYVYETLGTLIGGVVSTYLFVRYLHTFQTASLILLLHVIGGLILLLPPRDSGRFQKGLLALLLVLLPLSAYLPAGGPADKLHRLSIERQWEGLEVIHYENSRYGNICVIKNEGQYIYFVDGSPTLLIPIPDIPAVEEFVHIPLLSHPNPKEALVLSGGAGGVLDNILKHPSIETVTYVELDPLLISLLREFSTPLTETELTDERVSIKHGDGRFFLKTSDRSFDVMFVGIDKPMNLQANRFFTQEFFSLAEKRLAEGGILVLKAPGSLSLRNEALQNLNSTIYHSLDSVFSHIRVIPGESRNLFLSSNSPKITRVGPESIAEEIRRREISAEAMVPWHIENKLHEGWKSWFDEFIKGSTRSINTDFRPLGLFYSISYWNALYSPAFGKVFNQFEKLSLPILASAIPAFLLLYVLLRRRRGMHPASGIPLCILTTGFAGMIFDLVVIFAFQSIYGYVYSWIGVLVAAFMAGAAAGAMLMTRAMDRGKEGVRLFRWTEAGIILIAFVLPILFKAANDLAGTMPTLEALKILFLLVSFLCGFLTGTQFPLGNRVYLEYNPNVSTTAGLLYAYDLLGGWLGGIVGAVALLPVLGLTGSCVTIGMLKLAGFIVLTWTSKSPFTEKNGSRR
ncbi:MAG: fused MFS/spermidine synthase [Spirochaetia bacterium]